MPVGTVVVSPLRRSIETAYYLFKLHENFKKIKFILYPFLSSRITTAADVTSVSWADRIILNWHGKKLKLKLSKGISTDRPWQSHLTDQKTRLTMYNLMVNRDVPRTLHEEMLLEKISEIYPECYETLKLFKERVATA